MINRHYKKGIALLLSGVMALSPLCMQNSCADVMPSYEERIGRTDSKELKAVELLSHNMEEEELETSEDLTLLDDVSDAKEWAAPFYASEWVDSVRVSVRADAGVFPIDSRLFVEPVAKYSEKGVVDTAIDEVLEQEEVVKESIAFDIKILDTEGNVLQPDNSKGEVYVLFEQLDVNDMVQAESVEVFHLEDIQSDAVKLEMPEIDKQEGKVEVKTDHFSIFVVSFIQKIGNTVTKKTVGMKAGELTALSDVMNRLDVFYSDDKVGEIISSDVEKIEVIHQNEKYYLKAKDSGKVKLDMKVEFFSRILHYKLEIFIDAFDHRSGKIGTNAMYKIEEGDFGLTLILSGQGAIKIESDETSFHFPWTPYKNEIQKIVIEEGITSLGNMNSAFADMPKLTEVKFPNGLKYIPARAFYHSNNLGDVEIPESVDDIGEEAFWKDAMADTGEKNKIVKVRVGQKWYIFSYSEFKKTYNPDYSVYDGQSHGNLDRDELNGMNIIQAKARVINEVIKVDVRTEMHYKGQRIGGLNYVTYFKFSDSPTPPGAKQLIQNKDGEIRGEVSLYESILDSDTVVGNTNEDRITDRANYMHVVTYAKELGRGRIDEKDLKEYYSNVKTVRVNRVDKSDLDFQGSISDGLHWNLSKDNGNYTLTISGTGKMKDFASSEYEGEISPWMSTLHDLDDVQSLQLVIQEGVTGIGANAFKGMQLRGDLVLPNTIETIGKGAFHSIKVGNIQFPSRLKEIGAEAFVNVQTDTAIILHPGLKKIGEKAFFHSNDVGNVTIPSSVQEIGDLAFYKLEISLNGKNTITNQSKVKLDELKHNILFTAVVEQPSTDDENNENPNDNSNQQPGGGTDNSNQQPGGGDDNNTQQPGGGNDNNTQQPGGGNDNNTQQPGGGDDNSTQQPGGTDNQANPPASNDDSASNSGSTNNHGNNGNTESGNTNAGNINTGNANAGNTNPGTTDIGNANTGNINTGNIQKDNTTKDAPKNSGTTSSSSRGSSGGGGGGGGGGSSRGKSVNSKKSEKGNASSSSSLGTWIKDEIGWWYRRVDGSYPKHAWQKIGNLWYFFDERGYMKTGWTMSENAWYYLDESASHLAGSMRTGWVEWNQKWYYLSEASDQSNGKMFSNTVVGGYKLGADGAWDGMK